MKDEKSGENHDGPPVALRDRVRSLRLPEKLNERRAGGSMARILVILLLITNLASGGLAGYLWTRPKPEDKTYRRAAMGDATKIASDRTTAPSQTGSDATPPSSGTPSPTSSPTSLEQNNSLSPSSGAFPLPPPPEGNVVLEAKGYLVPAHQIQVSPKVGGMVVRLFIEEGKRVQKGDKLAELESDEYLSDYNRGRALLEAAQHRLRELEAGNRPEEIEQARAELAEVKAQQYELELEYNRNLVLRSKGQIAESDFRLNEANYRAAQHRVARFEQMFRLIELGPREERIAQAKTEVAQAEAELAKAKWRLDNCIIIAPVSGTILTKKAEEGNIVNPVAFNVSASLCEMADLSDMEVDLNIQERDISKVFVGQACRVRADAFPTRIYTGVVDRLMPIADRARGAIPIRVKVRVAREEEGVFLKPEMGVLVSFLDTKWLAPAPAITNRADTKESTIERVD